MAMLRDEIRPKLVEDLLQQLRGAYQATDRSAAPK
jgi:hypothetical protein